MTDKVDGVGTRIPGEDEGGNSLNPQTQAEKVTERAKEKGWKPLEEYDGDPADWVDAKEFVGRQKLYDRINDLKSTLTKQTRAFQSDMQVILANMSKVREQEHKKALKELEDQRRQAVAAEDVQAVVEVSKQIETLKEEKAEEKAAVKEGAQKTGEATPEFLEWQAKNKWFLNESEMRQDAISIGVGYAAGNPNKTQVDVLDYVTKKIKKMYPEQFKEARQVDSKVDSGGTTKPAPLSNKKMKFSDLSEEHQAIGKTLIKSGALKKVAEKNKRSEEEEYLFQYQANL